MYVCEVVVGGPTIDLYLLASSGPNDIGIHLIPFYFCTTLCALFYCSCNAASKSKTACNRTIASSDSSRFWHIFGKNDA